MNGSPNHKFTGAFVLGAIALIVTGLVVFGSGKLFQTRIPAVMYFEESVGGLDVGAPVAFNGVQVGIVNDIDLVWDVDDLSFLVQVGMDFLPDTIQYKGSSDELIDAIRRGDVSRDAELIKRGLRAQLGVSSILTGKLQINLVMRPNSEAEIVTADSWSPKFTEIPTIPSDISEVKSTVRNVMSKLSDLPLDEIFDNANRTLNAARELIEDPAIDETIADAQEIFATARILLAQIEEEVDPLSDSLLATSDAAGNAAEEASKLFIDARQALASVSPLVKDARDGVTRAEALLGTLQGTIEPGSPLHAEIMTALRQLTSAARSVRSLADTLERNPDSILFGR